MGAAERPGVATAADVRRVSQRLQTAGTSVGFVGIIALLIGFFGGVGGSCVAPVRKDIRWGTAEDWDMAEHICCHNTQFAEPSGYFQTQDLFGQLRAEQVGDTTTFFDSVCGLPLFRAPVGRTMSAFEEESDRHGWPSFRPAELIAENVIIHLGGRMSSTCGTHLGHNLPDFSGDRYCIDLVCIAGRPANGTEVGGGGGGGGSEGWGATEIGGACLGVAVLCCYLASPSASPRIAECLAARVSLPARHATTQPEGSC